MKAILIILSLILCVNVLAQDIGGQYYVATDGDDSNSGSYSEPFETWQAAIDVAVPGDTVYLRGGVWYPTDSWSTPGAGNMIEFHPHSSPSTGNDGTADSYICYFNYPGETPILDLSKRDMTSISWNTVIDVVSLNFVHFKGFTIRNAWQPSSGNPAVAFGSTNCTNIIYEDITIHHVSGRGFWHTSALGYLFDNTPPGNWFNDYDTTYFINCDAYDLYDSISASPGNAADGFKVHPNNYDSATKASLPDANWVDDVDPPGAAFILTGCRAWNCSDDGFDPSGSGLVVFDNCWAFNNGFTGALDGNGFKFGAVHDTVNEPTRILYNCIAAGNYRNGFYELDGGADEVTRNNARIYNNLSYANGVGFAALANSNKPNRTSQYYNNIAYGNTWETPIATAFDINIMATDGLSFYIESHNTWDWKEEYIYFEMTDTVTVTDDDFLSLDIDELDDARQADGSLPDIDFGKLVEGSDLINAGTTGVPDILSPISYNGTAPDIGPFESNYGARTEQPLTGTGTKVMISNGVILHNNE